MGRAGLTTIAALGAAGAVLLAAGEMEQFAVANAFQKGGTIRTYLRVVDAAGALVAPVDAAAFSATLGAAQLKPGAVRTFDEAQEGTAYIFLIDVSASLRQRQFGQMMDGIRAWIGDLAPQDRVALISFGDDTRVELDFSNDTKAVAATLDRLEPTGSRTLLYKGMEDALRWSTRQDEALPRRRMIVLLSDGIDDGSGLTLDDVVVTVRRVRTPVYTIGSAGQSGKGLPLAGLQRVSNVSGGRFWQLKDDSLAEGFLALKKSARQLYVVDFDCASCPPAGGEFELAVNATVAGRSLIDRATVRLAPLPPVAGPTPAEEPPVVQRLVVPAGALLVVGVVATAYLVRRRRRRVREAVAAAVASTPGPAAAGARAATPAAPSVLCEFDEIREGELASRHKLAIADVATIGCGPECDLSLTADTAGTNAQCRLHVENGRIVVSALESGAGTMVNGVPLRGLYRLEPGDVLKIGRTRLRFRHAQAP